MTQEQSRFIRGTITAIFLCNLFFLISFSSYPFIKSDLISLYSRELTPELMAEPMIAPTGLEAVVLVILNSIMLAGFIMGTLTAYGVGRILLPPEFHPLAVIFGSLTLTVNLICMACIFGAIFYARTVFEAALFMRVFYIILFVFNYLLAIYFLAVSIVSWWYKSYSTQVIALIFPLVAVMCGLNFQGLQRNQHTFVYLLPLILSQGAAMMFALDLFLQVRRLPESTGYTTQEMKANDSHDSVN